MRRIIASLFIAGCALLAVTFVLAGGEKGIPDSNIGLSKASVFDTPTPPMDKKNTSEPGDLPVFDPMFAEGPTSIPHGIDDLLPITFESNECIDCHDVDVKEEGEPTPIPESHYVDLRNAPGEVQGEVTGGRYVCVLCHIVPGENDVLVGNFFGK